MLTTISKLLHAWNERNIRYCHWKSTNHLDATIDGLTDLDVLVDRAGAVEAEQLALAIGFRLMDTVPLRSYPGVKDLVCLDESGQWVHIHLHYQLVLGDRWLKAYHLPIEERILERAGFVDDYDSKVIAPDDELYLFCARMAVKSRRPFNYGPTYAELKHIKGSIKGDWSEQVPLSRTLQVLDKMVRYASAEDEPSKDELNRYALQVRKALRSYRRFSFFSFHALSTLRCLYRYQVEFKRRILKNFTTGRRKLPNSGVIVAFVGADGSGKSTAVRRMERLFSQQMNVTRVFLGNGRSGASWYRRIAFGLFGARARTKGHKGLREGDRSSKPVPWYYSLWIRLCVHDKLKNLRAAAAAKANGSLVLADRWPQTRQPDVFDGSRLHGKDGLDGLARYAARAEQIFHAMASQYQADLLIRLVVSPDIALERKPGELSEGEMAGLTGHFVEIVWDARREVVVDADASMEFVDGVIRDAIWDTVN